jgi:hypothetical protein
MHKKFFLPTLIALSCAHVHASSNPNDDQWSTFRSISHKIADEKKRVQTAKEDAMYLSGICNSYIAQIEDAPTEMNAVAIWKRAQKEHDSHIPQEIAKALSPGDSRTLAQKAHDKGWFVLAQELFAAQRS